MKWEDWILFSLGMMFLVVETLGSLLLLGNTQSPVDRALGAVGVGLGVVFFVLLLRAQGEKR